MSTVEKEKRKIVPILVGLIGFFALTALDQLCKLWAIANLKGKESLVLIEGVFQLTYLENKGAAFGILQGKGVALVIITVVILAAVVYCYIRTPMHKKFRLLRVLMVVIAAGAVGNMIDRIGRGYVVDFFYFILIDFPIFNVADIYVTCSVVVLALEVLFGLKDEDMTLLGNSLKLRRR